MIYPTDYGIIPTSELNLNKNEVCARLQTSRDTNLTDFSLLISELEQNILCKYSAVRVPVILKEEDVVGCGFGEVKSVNLSRDVMKHFFLALP